MKYRRLPVFLVLIAMLAPVTAMGETTPDEYWPIPLPTADRQIGVSFDDREDYFFIGALRALVYKNGLASGPVCTSLNDLNCKDAEYFTLKALLSPCENSTQVNCIERLSARFPDGKEEVATFKGYSTQDEKYYWLGDSERNVPDSKTETIWNFPTLSHSGGKDFLLNVILDGTMNPKSSARWRRLVAMLQPVQKIADSSAFRATAFSNEDMSWISREAVISEAGWTGAQRGGLHKNCAATTDGFCFRREPFPEGIFFSISVRTSSPISGWIHGRMKSPEISLAKVGDSWRTIVGGLPTEVPVVASWFNQNEFGSDLVDAYKGAAYSSVGVGSMGVATRYGSTGQFDSVIINRLNAVRPYIKDKASANPKIWSFGSLDPEKLANDLRALSGRGFCISSNPGLTGILMANATVYDGSIPSFNPKTQSLDYSVSAPHYAANGSEFLGTYDLILRSDIARCIYGFEKTPTSATVSIMRGDSVEKVSTTTLSEKDGWLYLSAYGFTFSSPKISVKLSQPPSDSSASSSVASQPAAAKPNPAAKKPTTKTIYCVRGTSKKTVKGVSPTCPKGFKLVK